MKIEKSLRGRITQAGQDFLLEHFEQLEPVRQEALIAQLETIDFELVAALRAGQSLAPAATGALAPLPYVPLADRGDDTPAAARGREELKAGRVAFAMLAGGQASRLGWDGPKGTFPIGPASERSLFRILVEHILRAGKDYGTEPPLAVTTSATSDAAIKTFFERRDCFGLDREKLSFARQASLPALDDEGLLMLGSPERVFTSPDGHGGAVQALETDGILQAWQERGITTVCTFQVDNPILKVVDPDFIGRLQTDGVPLVTKVFLKKDPAHRVGVVVALDGRPAIVEYSEISREQAEQRDPDGQLTYRLGSIAVHAFTLEYLRAQLRDPLPLHTANKQIACVDAEGNVARRPGRKFERFLFDLFPRAPSITVVEVDAEREYGPVKNKKGVESPATARAALDREYRRWYAEAGTPPPDDEVLELSPLDAIGPRDL